MTLECNLEPADKPYVLFVSTFNPDIERGYVCKVYSKEPLLNTVEDASTGEHKLKELPPDHPTT